MVKKGARKQRGQISIFIIIAIVIIAVIAVIFISRGKIDLGGGNVNPAVAPVNSFVEGCSKETLEDAVYYVGQTGGYFSVPEKSTITGISFYVYDGENVMPSKKIVENEISAYINNMMFICTKNFVDFPDLEIIEGNITSKIKIDDNKVTAHINYPLSITKGTKTYTINSFNVEIPVRLGVIFNVANESVQEQLLHPKQICISCINNLAVDKNLYVELNEYDNETTIFSIIDKTMPILNESYRFNFANKYPLK
jgi:hypothetical protein